ncbi:MAG: 2-C-methyl-D-erythritol 2,4-cyclodiphosphate synthase [Thermoleophilaceae bacterium]|nr:2-C-methyl-D-erythritol 2,4-cyclodiphosphate synthase [Thermoleophilaceae bacterium]
MSVRSGIGYDSHRFGEGRRLVLGGVEVPEAERGLAGHSDADVLTHAAIDALLGAAGLGDIGQHYPDTDERWHDADSLDLLREVCRFLSEHGWTVGHLDATVICEAPKLGAHRDSMRARLSEAVGLVPLEVNVKFTTNEGMGFTGRGEGIAALAVATVERKRQSTQGHAPVETREEA